MFSDDFWSESDPPRNGSMQITLVGFLKLMAASAQTVFAAKYAPDDPPDHDAMGDQVTLPEVLKYGYRNDDTSI